MRPKKRNIRKGTFDVEVDNKSYEVQGKTVVKYNKDGTVRVRKFKAKGKKGTPVKKIKDVTRYKKG